MVWKLTVGDLTPCLTAFVIVAHLYYQKFSLQSREIYSFIFIRKHDENIKMYLLARKYLHNVMNNTKS